MGVPLLFKYFARQCPEAVKEKPPPGPVTHLYIDFNNVVHNCARMPEVSSEDGVIAASIAHVRHLASVIAPTDTIFVAVDGVPPRAKMLQQRCRRYAGSADAEADVDVDAEANVNVGVDAAESEFAWWNSCAVTPGTSFMRRLSAALHTEFWSVVPNPATTIVSDASDPGEGEQKLFKHLNRSLAPAFAVICGMDADLIVMGLVATLRGHTIHVARDATTYVDVNMLARHIHEKVMRCEAPRSSIRQFVAMLALLGNDFVPSLPGLSIPHGIDALVRALSRLSSSLVGEHSASINMGVLQAMLSELSHTESSAIRLAEVRAGTAAGHSIEPVAPGWRPRYNQRVFGQSHPKGVHEICKAYIAGIVWNAAYMLEHRALSDGFSYPWSYAPTAHDLALFLATSDLITEIPRFLGHTEEADSKARCLCRVSREAWQLCHVLPPSQTHLIESVAVQRAMTDARFGATHFYPVAFARSSYLVPASAPAHLHVPILPVFDDQILANAIIRATASLAAPEPQPA